MSFESIAPQTNLPIVTEAQPILAVSDIMATVKYWTDVLKFPDHWTWGEPPTFGGLRWGKCSVNIALDPELAAKSAGHSIYVQVKNVRALHDLHLAAGADIVEPIGVRPWNMQEYIIREIDGYRLRFGEPASNRSHSGGALPADIDIVARRPTADEYQALIDAVGWTAFNNPAVTETALASSTYAVVAQNCATGRAEGCAFLLSDSASFYYLKDVMVHPDRQGQRVGTALVSALMNWFDESAPEKAMIGLYTGEGLSPFYEQFGFNPAFGMMRRRRK